MLLVCSMIIISCKNMSKADLTHNTNNATSHLEIESSKYSFGKVSRSKQKKILCPFTLINTGSKLLVIQKIDVSCSCVSIKAYPKVIPPKKSKNLFVEINTEKQLGVFNKAIFINSNADNSLELVRIKGEIEE